MRQLAGEQVCLARNFSVFLLICSCLNLSVTVWVFTGPESRQNAVLKVQKTSLYLSKQIKPAVLLDHREALVQPSGGHRANTGVRFCTFSSPAGHCGELKQAGKTAKRSKAGRQALPP